LAEKLICITLDRRIYGDAFIGDKRLAELASVYASLVAVLESGKN
jgi:hypothetical protein